jgi:hypothetical protein
MGWVGSSCRVCQPRCRLLGRLVALLAIGMIISSWQQRSSHSRRGMSYWPSHCHPSIPKASLALPTATSTTSSPTKTGSQSPSVTTYPRTPQLQFSWPLTEPTAQSPRARPWPCVTRDARRTDCRCIGDGRCVPLCVCAWVRFASDFYCRLAESATLS